MPNDADPGAIPIHDDAHRPSYLSGMVSPGTRYGSAMLTYVQRPVFRGLGLAALIYIAVTGAWWQVRFQLHADWWIDLLFELIVFLGPLFLITATVSALMAHVRDQIQDWRAALTPRFMPPHLLMAGGLFVAITMISAAGLYYTIARPPPWRPTSLIGVTAVTLTFMTLVAWASAFRSSWFSLLIVPIIVLLARNRYANAYLESVMMDEWLNPRFPYNTSQLFRIRVLPVFIRIAVLLLDVWLLSRLGRRLAFGNQESRGRVAATRERFGQTESDADALMARPHCLARGFLTRAWHRRLPVLGRGAAWIMCAALGLFLVLVPLCGSDLRAFSIIQIEMLSSLILGNVIPALAVAMMWRERQTGFGYESLFPATRRQFSAEVAVAMAIDLIEFWLAAMIATLLPIAVWRANALSLPLTWVSLAACALIQILNVGAIFAFARLKNILSIVVILAALMLATALPLQLAWSDHPVLTAGRLVVFAGIEMTVGVLLVLLGYSNWSKQNL